MVCGTDQGAVHTDHIFAFLYFNVFLFKHALDDYVGPLRLRLFQFLALDKAF